MNKPKREGLISGVIGSIFTIFLFIVPFYFMFVNSIKSSAEANKLSIAWPSELHFENYIQVSVADGIQKQHHPYHMFRHRFDHLQFHGRICHSTQARQAYSRDTVAYYAWTDDSCCNPANHISSSENASL